MQVRTNVGALFTGMVLSGALALVDVGDGGPAKGPATPVVAIQAVTPDRSLPSFHPMPTDAQGRPIAVAPAQPLASPPVPNPTASSSTIDSYVWEGLRGGLAYLVVFALAHLALRRVRIGGRWPYAGIGSASAMASIASLTPLSEWRHLIQQGNLSQYLGFTLVAGAIFGFVYHWRAGLEAEGDDPVSLARTLKLAQDGVISAGTDRSPGTSEAGARTSADGALVDTGAAEYFNGPLQVRTSFPVMFVATLISAGSYCAILLAFGAASEMAAKLHVSLPFIRDFSANVQTNAVIVLGTGLITTLPFSLLLLFAHFIVRSLNKQSYLAYCASGLLAPVFLGLLTGPIGVILGIQGALPMAIAMGVYRNMAGLEAKPVKEDIMITDRRNLVGVDHARRQFGRLIKG